MKLSTLTDEELVQLKFRMCNKFKLTESVSEKIELQKAIERIDRVRLHRALKEEKKNG